MYIAEVDLNYAQYCPLAEVYVSLYPPKSDKEDDSEERSETKPKPPMWAEVESHMKAKTLNKLRNRAPSVQVQANTSKPIVRKPTKIAKPKPEPTIDTTGLNRRERRRKERGTNEVRTKNKSIGFAKNQEFGASLAVQRQGQRADAEDDDSDGGFFEE